MTDKEIVRGLRCCAKGLGHDDACENCKVGEIQNRRECIEFAAANAIERLTAENVVLPDGQVSAIESLLKEIEWKDMVISLAQRKQADAEADRDALLGKWISVDEKLPELGTRVIATDGVFVGEAIFARDSRWSGYGGGVLRDCIGSVVTHWMPLPPVPKEDAK